MAGSPSRKIASALVVSFSILSWCAPGAIAGDRVVDAGKLHAEVHQDPWSLTFTDKRGRSVLAEAPGTGTGEIGTLGFRTDDGWFRATRVRDASAEGKSFQALLDTTDPAGRRIEVRLSPDGGGAIALDAAVAGGGVGEGAAGGVSFGGRPRGG